MNWSSNKTSTLDRDPTVLQQQKQSGETEEEGKKEDAEDCLRCCSRLKQTSLTASSEFYIQRVYHWSRARHYERPTTESHCDQPRSIQLKEQNTRRREEERRERGMNVGKLQARLAAK